MRQVLQRELNSVNDNPIVDPDRGDTIFAGNFYGGHIALAMDLLKTAAASVADLIDRQYALLVDSRLNVGLPETLVGYEGCGLKALQLTCSALAARAVQRSAPDTVLSRPTEVNNQDKVSMGLNAALSAGEVATLLQQTLATLLVGVSNEGVRLLRDLEATELPAPQRASSMARRRRSAISLGASPPSRPVSTTNSSPPQRPTTSDGRTALRSASPIRGKTSTPAALW